MRTAAALSLFALLSPTTTAAGTCAPRAHLDGDREAITRVGDELHRLGVATEPPPTGCTAVEAAVQVEQGGGISVAIRDASRRSEGRVVGDAAVAAAWIDSWVRDDLAGFDDGIAAPSATPLMSRSLERDQPTGSTVPPHASALAFVDRVSLGASYAHAWTGDGSSWDGLEVAGCVHVGFACVGVRVAALFQPRISAQNALASRSDLSALATASTTLSLGRLAIVPELGIGVGRHDTSRVDGCQVPPAPGCDPTTDPANCPPPPKNCVDASGALFVGDHFEAITYSPRAAASLRIEIPLFDHVWLDGSASVVAMPFSHGDPFQPTPAAGPNPAPSPSLPGESSASYQIGIGLRIGAP